MNTYTKTLLNGIKAYVKKNTANDWDAEEGELGFISNKPFYDNSTVETITLFDIDCDDNLYNQYYELEVDGNNSASYDTPEVFNKLDGIDWFSDPPEELTVTINDTSYIIPFQYSNDSGVSYGYWTDGADDTRFDVALYVGYSDYGGNPCYYIEFGHSQSITWASVRLELETVVKNIKQIDKKFIPIQDTVKPIIKSYNQANEQLQWNREYQLLIESDTVFSLEDPQGKYPEEINLYLWSDGNYNIYFGSNDPIFTDNNLATSFSSMAVTPGIYEISLKQIAISGNWAILCAMRTPSALPSGA